MKNTAKVIKIINENEIVINCGSSSGVRKEDRFEIYSPGKDVIDPETHVNLGALDFIKATVEVTSVYPNMAICKNVDYVTIPGIGNYSALFGPKQTRKSLNVATNEISGDFANVSSKIHIGDLVRSEEG